MSRREPKSSCWCVCISVGLKLQVATDHFQFMLSTITWPLILGQSILMTSQCKPLASSYSNVKCVPDTYYQILILDPVSMTLCSMNYLGAGFQWRAVGHSMGIFRRYHACSHVHTYSLRLLPQLQVIHTYPMSPSSQWYE